MVPSKFKPNGLKTEPAPKKKVHPFVRALCCELRTAAEDDGLDLAGWAKAARSHVSTFEGWQNGSRGPTLLAFQAWAMAAGRSLGLLSQAPSMARGKSMKSETADVVRIMEGASDVVRAEIKARVLEFVVERASSPPDADED